MTLWNFLYSCHGSQILPIVVRQELWSALMLLPLFRADLRVPVDPRVMASDACLSGGAICRSVGLTAPKAARLAKAASLCDDEVVLFCFFDNIEAGRRAWNSFRWEWQLLFGLELTFMPSRVCRHAWPDVSMSMETKNPWSILCSQSVSVIRTLNR